MAQFLVVFVLFCSDMNLLAFLTNVVLNCSCVTWPFGAVSPAGSYSC